VCTIGDNYNNYLSLTTFLCVELSEWHYVRAGFKRTDKNEAIVSKNAIQE